MLSALVICTFSSCKETPYSEWIHLFDGTSTEGWRAYNGDDLPPGWAIKDSILTFHTTQILEEDYDYKGSRDIIYGVEEFEKFELYVEWKIPKGGNSGIFYHIKEGYEGPHMIAPEYQLIDDQNYATIHDLKAYNESWGLAVDGSRLCHAYTGYCRKSIESRWAMEFYKNCI